MRSNYVNQTGFRDGALIMHCHYVPHEDHGMMVKLRWNRKNHPYVMLIIDSILYQIQIYQTESHKL